MLFYVLFSLVNKGDSRFTRKNREIKIYLSHSELHEVFSSFSRLIASGTLPHQHDTPFIFLGEAETTRQESPKSEAYQSIFDR